MITATRRIEPSPYEEIMIDTLLENGNGQKALLETIQQLSEERYILRLRLAEPCLGPTIAMRRSVLDEIGGLRAFADVLAEDHAIGKAVRQAGFEVAFAPGSIGHACFDSGSWPTLARQLRVARTIKFIDPIGYAGSVIVHPLALALLGMLLGASGAPPGYRLPHLRG